VQLSNKTSGDHETNYPGAGQPDDRKVKHERAKEDRFLADRVAGQIVRPREIKMGDPSRRSWWSRVLRDYYKHPNQTCEEHIH